MTANQLILVGLNGRAAALDRDTGVIVWSNQETRRGYVTFLLDGDRLVVSTNGYIYCPDPLTGAIRWHNPMTAYGSGTPTSLASVRGASEPVVVIQAVKAQRDHAATASSGSAPAVAS